MSRTKGAENLSEFSVYFYPSDDISDYYMYMLSSSDGQCCATVRANSSVSACMQVIQDFNPVRITKVYKLCPLPSLVMGG